MPCRRSSYAILLAAAAACGDNWPGPDGRTTAELGGGSDAFEPIADESDQILVAGPQGGHHFIVNARMTGLAPGDPTRPGIPDDPSTSFTVRDEAGERIDADAPPYRLGYELVDGSDALYQLPSGRIVLIQEDLVDAGLVYGARVRIRVEITDASGASAADERWVHAIHDPALPVDAGLARQ